MDVISKITAVTLVPNSALRVPRPQGDSGGPLVVYESDGRPTLVGITSFGIGFGCQVSWPPAFTRVSSYLDWIEQGIKTLSA